MDRRLISKRILFAALCFFGVVPQLFAGDWIKPVERWFYIKSVQAGGRNAGFWDQPGSDRQFRNGNNLMVFARTANFLADQRFMFKPVGEGVFNIVAMNGGYVTVEGGASANGTNVYIGRGRGGDPSQNFRIEHLGGGRFKIHPIGGGVICLAGRSHADRSNIHVWTNHEGAFTEWFLLPSYDGEAWVPGASAIVASNSPGSTVARPGASSMPSKVPAMEFAARGMVGNLVMRDIHPDGREFVNPAQGVTVELWVFDPANRDNMYRIKERFLTNMEGFFTIPSSYYSEQSIMLMAHIEGRGSAFALVNPMGRKITIDEFQSLKYLSKDYHLVETRYRGRRWIYREGAGAWQTGGTITRRDSFFFKDLDRPSAAVDRFYQRAFAGVDRSTAHTDEAIVEKVAAVLEFLRTQTWSYMTANAKSDPRYAASDELFSKSRSSSKAPLSRWPTLEEYADVWLKHGFLPTGNCTSWALMTAALMRGLGVPPGRFFVSKFNYDHGWIVEHWVIALELGGRWVCFDPQFRNVLRPSSPVQFLNGAWDRYWSADYEWDMPFEAVLLPGGSLSRMPYIGDASKLFPEELPEQDAVGEEAFGAAEEEILADNGEGDLQPDKEEATPRPKPVIENDKKPKRPKIITGY